MANQSLAKMGQNVENQKWIEGTLTMANKGHILQVSKSLNMLIRWNLAESIKFQKRESNSHSKTG